MESGGTYGQRRLSSDNTDKTIDYSELEIESEVDTDVTGCYEVIYTFEDTVNGTGTASERLYVVVTEGGTD